MAARACCRVGLGKPTLTAPGRGSILFVLVAELLRRFEHAPFMRLVRRGMACLDCVSVLASAGGTCMRIAHLYGAAVKGLCVCVCMYVCARTRACSSHVCTHARTHARVGQVLERAKVGPG